MLEQFVLLKIWLSKLGEKSCHLKTIMHLFKPRRLGVCKWWLLGEELMWRGLSQTKNSHLVKSRWLHVFNTHLEGTEVSGKEL